MDDRPAHTPTDVPTGVPADTGSTDAEWRARLRASAVEAERATGRREETEAKARANILVRLARMTMGSVVLLAGVACLVLPGPGWLLIAAGLAILARDVAWAERLLVAVRRRIPGSTEDGQLSRRTIVVSVALMLLGAAASAWFALR